MSPCFNPLYVNNNPIRLLQCTVLGDVSVVSGGARFKYALQLIVRDLISVGAQNHI